MVNNRFAKFTWGVLIYNLGVILWGALVRATGSGAGCGSHWPLCDGVVMPREPQVETLIELTHRLTSGVALILVAVMLVWALRSFPQNHPVRLGAKLSMFLIITEALLGAGLVLFEWVADDASLGRVISMPVHLVNTFLLLAALTLTAWWASGGEPVRLRGQGLLSWGFGIGFFGMMLVGASGAITALGDTLFPAGSLAEIGRFNYDATAHFLKSLRVWHPIVSILVGFYLAFLAGMMGFLRANRQIKRFALSLVVLFCIQLIAGLVNLILLAPVWMQLIHLLLADLIWIALVLLAAATLAVSEVEALSFKVVLPSPISRQGETG